MAKTCFVIMGFHKRTDYPTGRTLDLDNPAESDRWQREAAGSSASHPEVLNEMTERLAKLNALLEHSPLRFLAV